MKDKTLLKLCSKFLKYNENTGVITWKIKPNFSTIKIGDEAGGETTNGYRGLMIDGKKYLSHRIAFLITYGFLPRYIDHINGQKLDNRLCNLRECTHSQNLHNQGIQSNNSSGYKGVSWHKNTLKWCAKIEVNKVANNLGLFKCKHEAARAYNKASKRLSGEFGYQNIITRAGE